ncbi:hypothetical protein PG993_007573 [Apiospora rasikravindrae]|uniref:BZIP transcription factor n=1 Tax=Apiospora rasikravindrae TaxID=990691 RepID=A0ABR1SXW4_9PEZI
MPSPSTAPSGQPHQQPHHHHHHNPSSTTIASASTTAADSHTPAASIGSPSAYQTTTGHKRGLSQSLDGHSPTESNASSPHPLRDNTSAPDDQRARKRKPGPGSRGVANLTPEQLAKKRANDREAQRAIRERTKNQIEALEKRIRDLTSQQPYQELQAVIRAKEEVEAENADLKNRMASIVSLIQPVLRTPQGRHSSLLAMRCSPLSRAGAASAMLNNLHFMLYQLAGSPNMHLGDGAYSAPPIQPFISAQVAPAAQTHLSAPTTSTPPSTASPNSAEQSWHPSGAHSTGSSVQASPNFAQVKLIGQQRAQALELGAGEQLRLDFLLDPSSAQKLNRMQTGINGAQDSPAYSHLPMKHDWNGVPIPTASRSCTLAQPLAQSQTHHPCQNGGQMGHDQDPSWMALSAPKNCGPTCPLDSLLLDFLHERRQRAAEGVSAHEIVGPRYPSVSSLLNPANSAYSHPLSKVFTDILATFPGICGLPERVAVLYVMFLVMRWQISPSKENYDLLPPWARLQPSQVYISHPAWIDHLPFPHMRERMAKDYNPADYFFENFFIPFTTTLSLNWPYEETDCLLQSPDGDELLINPVFERHMRRLENWTLGDAFHQTFPQLDGTYNLKRDGSIARNNRDGSLEVRPGST